MIDKLIYETLNWFNNIKIDKDSPLRDSMFWYLVITAFIYFSVLFWGITRG